MRHAARTTKKLPNADAHVDPGPGSRLNPCRAMTSGPSRQGRLPAPPLQAGPGAVAVTAMLYDSIHRALVSLTRAAEKRSPAANYRSHAGAAKHTRRADTGRPAAKSEREQKVVATEKEKQERRGLRESLVRRAAAR